MMGRAEKWYVRISCSCSFLPYIWIKPEASIFPINSFKEDNFKVSWFIFFKSQIEKCGNHNIEENQKFTFKRNISDAICICKDKSPQFWHSCKLILYIRIFKFAPIQIG